MNLDDLPNPSDLARLKALIGPAWTKMISMAGQKLSADEALSYRLIDRICPHNDLSEITHELRNSVCATSPNHAAAIKQMLATAEKTNNFPSRK